TDFLKLIESEETKKSTSRTSKGTIKKFDGYIISAEKDSLSYIVMVSPYLSTVEIHGNSKMVPRESIRNVCWVILEEKTIR
ncbi:MAG: hypothetical protein II069_02515, partial [Oscillospiraceae bacterium]|nr:hypothetical protein [Oscillospiraceae bacterium]